MQVIPVNTNDVEFSFVECVPKADQNGVQRRNAANVPQWSVRVLAVTEGQRPIVTEVTIAQESPPELTPLSPCQFEKLVARGWSQGDRSGIAFSAEQVRPSGKRPTAAVPTPNASEPKPAA
jgi:hypothetical protein